MLSTDIIVNNFAQTLIAGIQSNIRTKRVTQYGAMDASGASAESLKFTWDGKKLSLYSTEKYFTVLETGRGPGKRPPMSTIEKWLEDKPVAVQEISKKSLAYLIARKIGIEGSKLFRQGGNSGVISDYINEKYVTDNLTQKLFQAQIEIITNQFLKAG